MPNPPPIHQPNPDQALQFLNPMIHVNNPGAHRQGQKADVSGLHTRCAAALLQVV